MSWTSCLPSLFSPPSPTSRVSVWRSPSGQASSAELGTRAMALPLPLHSRTLGSYLTAPKFRDLSRPPFQHAHHAAVRFELQCLLGLPDALQPLLQQPPRPSSWCLGAEGRIRSAFRHVGYLVLHVASLELYRCPPRPGPHRALHCFRAWCLRGLFQDVD